MTPARERMERAGFHMGWVTVDQRADRGPWQIMMSGGFECVCGRLEGFTLLVNQELLEHTNLGAGELFDPAGALARMGSFSREHLLADGYSADDVERIVARFEGRA